MEEGGSIILIIYQNAIGQGLSFSKTGKPRGLALRIDDRKGKCAFPLRKLAGEFYTASASAYASSFMPASVRLPITIQSLWPKKVIKPRILARPDVGKRKK